MEGMDRLRFEDDEFALTQELVRVLQTDLANHNLSGSHLQSQVICVRSVNTIRTPVVDVIGRLIRDVIGRLSVEP